MTTKPSASSLDFNLLDEDEEGTETVAGTNESAEDDIYLLEPPSIFINAARIFPDFPESSSPGKVETTRKRLLTEYQRTRE